MDLHRLLLAMIVALATFVTCIRATRAAEPPQFENAPVADEEIASLLRQSQAFAPAVRDRSAAVVLVELYVRLGQLQSARAVALSVQGDEKEEEEEDKLSAMINLAASLAMVGQGRAAMQVADSLDRSAKNPAATDPRSRALFMASFLQGVHRDFPAAYRTVGQIESKAACFSALRHLAELEAKAGRYDEAARTMEKMEAVSPSEQETREELKAFIARYRARRQIDPPPPKDHLGQLRAMVQVFAMAEDESAVGRAPEEAIQAIPQPIRRAEAWLDLAYARFREGKASRCRAAMASAQESAEKTPPGLSFPKAMILVRLADLALQLGDAEAAATLAARAWSAGLEKDFTGTELNRKLIAFTGAPLAIATLMRAGKPYQAFQMAVQVDDGLGWSALGVAAAHADRVKDLEKRLPGVQSDKAKAIVFAGMAYGLHERKSAP